MLTGSYAPTQSKNTARKEQDGAKTHCGAYLCLQDAILQVLVGEWVGGWMQHDHTDQTPFTSLNNGRGKAIAENDKNILS